MKQQQQQQQRQQQKATKQQLRHACVKCTGLDMFGGTQLTSNAV
jgi:hypothetical protein